MVFPWPPKLLRIKGALEPGVGDGIFVFSHHPLGSIPGDCAIPRAKI